MLFCLNYFLFFFSHFNYNIYNYWDIVVHFHNTLSLYIALKFGYRIKKEVFYGQFKRKTFLSG